MSSQVTVVIPNYNGARFVGQTIESLLAQTYRDFLLVFLDDQSTDDSLAVAESYSDPRYTVVRSDERVSMAGNWNRAAGMARTPYFVLAHNDDVYEPEYLEAMVALLAASPDAFAAHCKARTIDEENRPVQIPGQVYKDALWPREDPCKRPIADEIAWLRKGNIVIAPSVMYRTEAFNKIGPFNERFQFVTDWEYWLRGLLEGYSLIGTHRRLLRWRRHGGTATKAHEASLGRFREEAEVCRWIAAAVRDRGLAGDPNPDYGLVLNTLLSEFAARLAAGDVAGARAAFDMARAEIPTLRGSWQSALMRAALGAGVRGGRLLKRAEAEYLRLLNARPKRVWAAQSWFR